MYIGKHIEAQDVLFLAHTQIRECLNAYRKGESCATAEQCVDYISGILENSSELIEMLKGTS